MNAKVRHRSSWCALVPALACLTLLRRVSMRWGASDQEVGADLPGDELLPHADLCVTRAVTIRAAADEVWPWIAQFGQGRGGFYSYDVLENLIGCDIHSADRIIPQWQTIAAGDQVNLAPEVGLTVTQVDPVQSLVLRGGIPSMVMRSSPYDFTWAFVLSPASDGTTRPSGIGSTHAASGNGAPMPWSNRFAGPRSIGRARRRRPSRWSKQTLVAMR